MARNGADSFWSSYMIADDRNRPMREYAAPMFNELNPSIEQPEIQDRYCGNQDYDSLNALANSFYGNNSRVSSAYDEALMKLKAEVDSMSNMMKNWMTNDVPRQPTRETPFCLDVCCVFCGGSHTFDNCPSNPESIFYVGNQGSNHINWYSNTNEYGWKTHQPFMWSGQETEINFEPNANETFYPPVFHNQVQQQVPQSTPIPISSSLEEFMRGYIARADAMIESQAVLAQSQAASRRNLEVQFEEFANEPRNQAQGELSSDTENPQDDSVLDLRYETKEVELQVEEQEHFVENLAGNFIENVAGNSANKSVAANQLENLLEHSIALKSGEEELNSSLPQQKCFVENSISTKSLQNEEQSQQDYMSPPPNRTDDKTVKKSSNFLLNSQISEKLEDPIVLHLADHSVAYPKRKIVECFVLNIFVAKRAENEILLLYDRRMCNLFEGNASDEVEHKRYEFVPKKVLKRRVIKWPWLKVSTVLVDF